MKKILLILLCGMIMIGNSGCRVKMKKDIEDVKTTYKKVGDYFGDEFANRNNLGAYSLEENNVVVSLIDNSKEKQEEFLKQAKVNANYIKFEKGGPYHTITGIDFYLSKLENYNSIKFNTYYENNGRTIYLAGNLDEVYVIVGYTKMTLSDYIQNVNQTLDASIQSITDHLTMLYSFDDGGTSVFKSEEKDITMITCKTLAENRNIYIGDYQMNYKTSMCK